MATQFQNAPDQFQSAAAAYVKAKQENNPGAVGAQMSQYAQSVSAQHQVNLIASKQRSDISMASTVMDGRLKQIEDQMDGLASQGAVGSSQFAALDKERSTILAQKVNNPAFSYNADQKQIDDTNLQTRLSVATLTGAARDEALKTGDIQGVLQKMDVELRKLPISEKELIAYEGEVTRHLSAMSSIGAAQRLALSDHADVLRKQAHDNPDTVTDQQLDDMSLQLQRAKMFSKAGEVGASKVIKNVLAPAIASGNVQDVVRANQQITALAAGSVPGASGRGLINAPYTRPVDQPTSSGLSPQTLYSYYLAKGATKNEALLLTGAAGSEGVYNPQAVHDDGVGYGLFGHNRERLDAMRQSAGSFTPTWQQQADFSLKELRSRPEGARANAATSADQLADAQMAYEQPRAYTNSNPRAGENYTGRLNTIRHLSANLKDAPSLAPGDGGSDLSSPMVVSYKIAVQEAGKETNKLAERSWTNIQSAYDKQMQPTAHELADMRDLVPFVTDAALRQKITEGLTVHQASDAFRSLPTSQQQDISTTLQSLGQGGQLDNLQRRIAAPVAAQAAQMSKMAEDDPIGLGVLRVGPRAAQAAGMPALQPLDPNDPNGYVAGLKARQTWKNVARQDPSVSNIPWRPQDFAAFKAQAPNWTPQQAQTALGSIGSTLTGPEQEALFGNKDFRQTVLGLAHSGDPVKMNAAYALLDAQYRRSPMTFQAEDGGKTMLELRSWQALGQFLPPQEVAKRMSEASDPNVVKAKEGLEATARKNLESLDASNVVRSIYGWHVPLVGTYVPFTAPGDIASERPAQAAGALMQDYHQAYTDMFKETGDASASDKFAQEKLSNKYSVSSVNGGRVTAYAPDREVVDPSGAGSVGAYYPKVDGSFDWLKAQLFRDVANSRFGHDFRLDNRNQTLPEIALLPDAKTEADVAAKRPPSYQVIARSPTDGRFHLIEGDMPGQAMRFRGDAEVARRAAAPSIAARQEFLRYQGQMTAEDAPPL